MEDDTVHSSIGMPFQHYTPNRWPFFSTCDMGCICKYEIFI